jgi:hypothetical protein
MKLKDQVAIVTAGTGRALAGHRATVGGGGAQVVISDVMPNGRLTSHRS